MLQGQELEEAGYQIQPADLQDMVSLNLQAAGWGDNLAKKALFLLPLLVGSKTVADVLMSLWGIGQRAAMQGQTQNEGGNIKPLHTRDKEQGLCWHV